MPQILEIKIPDIGDFQEVTVIEVLVKPGDRVQVEDSLITLESDKATMDVPSPAAGTVKEVKVKVGDKVAEGALVLLLETCRSREGDTHRGCQIRASRCRAGIRSKKPRGRPAPPSFAGMCRCTAAATTAGAEGATRAWGTRRSGQG